MFGNDATKVNEGILATAPSSRPTFATTDPALPAGTKALYAGSVVSFSTKSGMKARAYLKLNSHNGTQLVINLDASKQSDTGLQAKIAKLKIELKKAMTGADKIKGTSETTAKIVTVNEIHVSVDSITVTKEGNKTICITIDYTRIENGMPTGMQDIIYKSLQVVANS